MRGKHEEARLPYQVSVDSGSREEPATRYFGSLETAWLAFNEIAEEWKPFAEVRRQTRVQDRWCWFKIDRNGRVLP